MVTFREVVGVNSGDDGLLVLIAVMLILQATSPGTGKTGIGREPNTVGTT